MKVFVTGLCGYLGRSLAADCSANGDQVLGIDTAGWPQGCPIPSGVQLVQGSLEDHETIRPLLAGCEGLIHTAGLHLVNGATRSLGDFLHVNVELTGRLLDLALQSGVKRYVLSSTMCVLIGVKRPFSGSSLAMLDEQVPPHTGHPYPISKLLVEALGREFAQQHLVSLASLRFMTFGHGMEETGPNLLAWVVTARDAARACRLALQRDDLRGEVFHISSGTPLTNALIAQAQRDPLDVVEFLYPGAAVLLKEHGYEVRPDHFTYVTDCSKARRMLGYEPQDTFAAWLRNHGWKPTQ